MKKFWKYFVMNIKQLISDLRSRDKNKIKKQIPNVLTLIRGVVAPITIIPAVIKGNIYFAFIAIAICSLTDTFDGWYARNFNAQSEFGALLDAICDKLFVLTLAIPLGLTYTKWAVLILILELIISIINVIASLKGYITKSSLIGKVKTVFLDSSIALCYLSFIINIPKLLLECSFVLANIMQLMSIFGYGKKYIKQQPEDIITNEI